MADRSRAGRVAGSALLGLGLLLGMSGCAGDALSTEDPAATDTAATTTSSSEETSSSATETSADGTSATDTSAADESDGPLEPEDEGRRLTLADFHMPTSAWDEERYDIADQKDVLGIAAEVNACGDFSPQELELRLGNNFEELTFSVAQANDSRNSDQQLSVEVLANNEQAEIRSVPFNQVQEFTIDVEGVNALKILFYLDDNVDGCGGSVIGVVSDTTVN
jgi:hypothetical protein